MAKKTLNEVALAWAAKVHKLRDALVVDHTQAVGADSEEVIHRLRVVSAADANGASHVVFVDENAAVLEASAEREAMFAHGSASVTATAAAMTMTSAPSAPITISPTTNTLVLNPGDTLDEVLTVTVPENAGPTQADVYFLADTTGSMGGILNAVKAGANNVLTALSGLGADVVFGVGNYKDFLQGDPYCFKHQTSPTNVAATVTAAINTWSAAGGGDTVEGGLFALDSLAVPPGGSIGWRAGSKRIVVWFGDAPAHDPICPGASGQAVAITEASVTAKLVAQGIAVVAISTATPGLDDDPKINASGYLGTCGAPGGLPGQATRISGATGGAFATGINPGNIVNTIISLVSGAIGGIKNLKLVPSAAIAPFIGAITPAAGYGPLAGNAEHVLKFDVHFVGVPCKPEAQVFGGSIDVVADGVVVAAKRVQITVPACAPKGYVYSVKFVCGSQPECECQCGPLRPGHYATEINLLNPTNKAVNVLKRFIPVVLAGAPVGREPRFATARAEDKIVLPPHSATMDDCCRISELLLGAAGGSGAALHIGYLEITADADIVVTAVYTAGGATSGAAGAGVSIDVAQIVPHRV